MQETVSEEQTNTYYPQTKMFLVRRVLAFLFVNYLEMCRTLIYTTVRRGLQFRVNMVHRTLYTSHFEVCNAGSDKLSFINVGNQDN